ncbi:hypothetical protein RZS28_15360 [Methylocapsa polymorpha]|uniref:Uncharacterized protein n=1 Tax=Methylocapsa polymorpha TaxID=3080828 RepID=A0ABZ0HQS2_9HYPH|nr:hypothetical protein RZS28_15360 [Methylocapsa sp. RX1]
MSGYPAETLKTIAEGLALTLEPAEPPMSSADLEALKALVQQTGDMAQALEKWEAIKSRNSQERAR